MESERKQFEELVRASLPNEDPILQLAAIERLAGYAIEAAVSLDTVAMLFDRGLTYNEVVEVVLSAKDGKRCDSARVQ